MIRITTHMAGSFLLILSLLLEVGSLRGLVLAIKLSLALKLVLILGLVGLEVIFLHHMCTRTSIKASNTCILCSRLFLNMKRTNEIRNGKLLSLMFQRSSKVPP